MIMKLERLRSEIADRCIEIEEMFKVPVYVTCIVRQSANPEGDVLVTNEPNIDDIVAVIDRSKKRTKETHRGVSSGPARPRG